MTKQAKKKKPAKKKKLALNKETVRKLSDKDLDNVAGGLRAAANPRTVGCNSYMTCNMMCQSDPTACNCK